MSLILTSQNNAVNSSPNNYQNYFANTYKIEKNSLIALNHVTVNRNAFFNFDEEKVLAFYHGVEMPSNKTITMKSFFKDTNGDKFTLLRGEPTTLNSRQINNFVNYPMFVMVDKGEYSIEQLCETLQFRLNNPTASYGGDYHVTGFWKVDPQYDADNTFTHIFFTWDTFERITTAAFPDASDFKKKYEGDTAIEYNTTVAGGREIKGSKDNVKSVVGEFYRYVSHNKGQFKYHDMETDGTIVGLTRVTNGRDYLTSGTNFYGEDLYTASGQDSNFVGPENEQAKICFFDYCVATIGGELQIWYLDCDEEGDYSMEKYEYGAAVTIKAGSTNAKFTIDGNNMDITLVGNSTKTVTLELPPINNNTYQLIPKVVILGEGKTTLTTGAPPDLLADTIVPVVPDKVIDGATDFSNCNVGWIMENCWAESKDWESSEGGGNITRIKLSNNYLQLNYYKFHTWTPLEPDIDSTRVLTNGVKMTIAEMKAQKYWWSYDFDPTLNAAAGGFKYHYMLKDAAKDYIYDSRGTVIIPYPTKSIHYHCGATLDGAVGILPRFSKGIEITNPAGNLVIGIEGTDRIALNNNDLLYIRIDLGNVYSVNGTTSSISKIISPIITNTNTTVDSQLGIRTFCPPEKVYLKLNNAETLYINSIEVSIVTKGEALALDLAPTTSASFHIKAA